MCGVHNPGVWTPNIKKASPGFKPSLRTCWVKATPGGGVGVAMGLWLIAALRLDGTQCD